MTNKLIYFYQFFGEKMKKSHEDESLVLVYLFYLHGSSLTKYSKIMIFKWYNLKIMHSLDLLGSQIYHIVFSTCLATCLEKDSDMPPQNFQIFYNICGIDPYTCNMRLQVDLIISLYRYRLPVLHRSYQRTILKKSCLAFIIISLDNFSELD